MPQLFPWTLALAALAAAGGILAWWWSRARTPRAAPLPSEWSLTARPVFSTDERRVYRQLREALPHHIVLAKLPLVRFSQPADQEQVRYWYELLGSIDVTFAVCSANGRVLAAIDLDNDRAGSRRVQQIKQSVLGACRVRYLRCAVDHMPSIPELQLLVPQSTAAARGPRAAAPAPAQGWAGSQASAPTSRQGQRTALWQDSGFFQDSFFGPDSRADTGSSEFGAISRILRGGAGSSDHRPQDEAQPGEGDSDKPPPAGAAR